MWYRRRQKKRDEKKRSRDLFFYLAERTTKTSFRIMDELAESRSDILVVMSFCLIAEVTFIASNVEVLARLHCAALLVAASLAMWIVAFLIGMNMHRKIKGVYAVPGGNEHLDFLATAEDVKAFMDSDTRPYDADEFLSLSYLARIKAQLPARPKYDEIIDAYRREAALDRGLADFNENAWLGFLVQLTHAATKQKRVADRTFKLLHILFSVNLVLLVAAIALCLFHGTLACLVCAWFPVA